MSPVLLSDATSARDGPDEQFENYIDPGVIHLQQSSTEDDVDVITSANALKGMNNITIPTLIAPSKHLATEKQLLDENFRPEFQSIPPWLGFEGWEEFIGCMLHRNQVSILDEGGCEEVQMTYCEEQSEKSLSVRSSLDESVIMEGKGDKIVNVPVGHVGVLDLEGEVVLEQIPGGTQNVKD